MVKTFFKCRRKNFHHYETQESYKNSPFKNEIVTRGYVGFLGWWLTNILFLKLLI